MFETTIIIIAMLVVVFHFFDKLFKRGWNDISDTHNQLEKEKRREDWRDKCR